MKQKLHLSSHLKKSPAKKPKVKRRHGKMTAKGYTLFKRKGSSTWYFYTLEAGRRIARSTGKEDQDEARDFVRRTLNPGTVEADAKKKTFGEFAADFFVWGKCAWIKAKLESGGHFSQGAAIGRRTHLVHWIFPKFKDRLVSSLTPKELRDWIYSLPLSGQSRNHIKYSLKTIFSEAVFAGLIERNPITDIKNVELHRKERDAFTLEDLAKLFPLDRQELFRVWGDAGMAMLFLTLAATGIRSGEARALQWKHVGADAVVLADGTRAEIPYLMIEQGVKFYSNEIGSTKSGKGRPVYLPERARAALEWWRKNTYGANSPGDLVFPGNDGKKPIDEELLRARFKKALVKAGVDVAGRNLVPHSFRHAYVTRSKKALPADLLLLMAGHADERVQRGYVHPTLAGHLQEMAAAQALIEGAARW
jgi:integrase